MKASNEPRELGSGGGHGPGAQAVHERRQAETAVAIARTSTPLPLALSRRDALLTFSVLVQPLVGPGSPPREPDSSDATLAALSVELCEVEAKARRLLAGDDRDAADIPGYVQLADRSAALVDALRRIRAEGRQGLVAKARAVAIRDAQAGYDGAISIAISLAVDVAAVLGPDGGTAGIDRLEGQDCRPL